MFGFLKRKSKSGGLQGGYLSRVSQNACDGSYVYKCVEGADTQQKKFSMFLCLLPYRSAEVLVNRIEQDPDLLQFYKGTSRDVLIFESFMFYQYLISEFARKHVRKKWRDSFDLYTHIAAKVGASIAKETLGEIDAQAHRDRRLQPLLKYGDDGYQLTETFCVVLQSLSGKQHVGDPDGPLSLDIIVNLKLRDIAHVKSSTFIQVTCKAICKFYDEYFDLEEYNRMKG